MTGGVPGPSARAAGALALAAAAAAGLASTARGEVPARAATVAPAARDAPAEVPAAAAEPVAPVAPIAPASDSLGAPPAGRRLHGSVGAGGALILTGDRGDRARLELAADCKLGGRYGILAAWRAPDEHHRGLVTAGLVFEAGAARPRLVLDLHADVGADLDAVAPLAGGGIRTTIGLAGPLGIVLDAGGYLVLAGLADTRLQLQSSVLFAARW